MLALSQIILTLNKLSKYANEDKHFNEQTLLINDHHKSAEKWVRYTLYMYVMSECLKI